MKTLLLIAAISAPAFSTPSTQYFGNWRVIQADGKSVITGVLVQ
ncbi:hypothetical protein [Parashewanella curva]|nr:hypothetical protein [Parashewanella curva]